MTGDKKHRLLHILARGSNASQRRMAREAGVSLGMVNLIVRHFVKTGYIKVAGLNRNSIRYVLTPRGSAALTQRSYEYLLHVISSFGELREGIAALVMQLHREGRRYLVIYGDGDVADIAELACRSDGLKDIRVVRQTRGEIRPVAGQTVLDCRLGVPAGARVGIDVLGHLADPKT